ncbi:hypothetical protein C5167_013842 [Papaver somniferum]|uniref:Uncharacterized protein n=1 Tax=Papaver somniferum TaxID=3469 RepID=A0A4Y7J4L1_PAPSO|nr:hypothetical protein C5167_013842 [Papaver somniferum]
MGMSSPKRADSRLSLKIAEEMGMSSPKRADSRLSLSARSQKATAKSNLLESVAQLHGAGVVSHTDENGAVRMKIRVKKQDLKQMLEMMNNGQKNNTNDTQHRHQSSTLASSDLSLEQRLHFMRRRHQRRVQHAREDVAELGDLLFKVSPKTTSKL